MSDRDAAVIDGPAHAEPCACPACLSPFVKSRHRQPARVPAREPGLMYFDFDAGKVRIEPGRNSTVSA